MTHYLLAELPSIVHCCRWHGMVTAKLTLEWPGNIETTFKNAYSAGRGTRLLSYLKCPNWLWGIPSLLVDGYWGYSSWGLMLNTHFRLVPRWGMSWAIPSTTLYASMACTQRTLPSSIEVPIDLVLHLLVLHPSTLIPIANLHFVTYILSFSV